MKLVNQTVKPFASRTTITVELDPVDIDVLSAILRQVVGPHQGPQSVANQLLEMLKEAGARSDLDMIDHALRLTGRVCMVDTFPENCGK